MNNLISIIIPHYNTPDTLLRLLRSIPVRDDIEVIVVDDNSDNISLNELYKKISVFPHVQLFLNDSGVKGAGASRNIALRKAKGKWLLFADADDFFVEGFYEKISPYLDSDYDIVYFPPTSIDDKTREKSTRHVTYMEYVNRYYHKPNFKNLTALKYGFCTPVSKLIRFDILKEHNLSFEEILVGNDIMCMTKCAYYSQKIKAMNEIIYCITRSAGTLTSKRDEQNFDTRTHLLIRHYCFLKNHLSRKEFRYTQINRAALSIYVKAIADHWGIRKLFEIMKLYRRNNVKCFDIGLLNPIILFQVFKKALLYFKNLKKHR